MRRAPIGHIKVFRAVDDQSASYLIYARTYIHITNRYDDCARTIDLYNIYIARRDTHAVRSRSSLLFARDRRHAAPIRNYNIQYTYSEIARIRIRRRIGFKCFRSETKIIYMYDITTAAAAADTRDFRPRGQANCSAPRMIKEKKEKYLEREYTRVCVCVCVY